MPEIITNDLTNPGGSPNGVFDQLMDSIKGHLTEEYRANRIKGVEYSQVYLGALTEVMNQSVAFLLAKGKAGLEMDILQQQLVNLQATKNKIDKEIELLDAQLANEITQNTVLIAQECKLRAEFDVLSEQRLKVVAETALLGQKRVTEQAQTSGTGVDVESVIGKQLQLYSAQTAGFQRDAEQRAAKLMLDTWNVRRTTDDGTQANSTNNLDDVTLGRFVTKLAEGINA